MLFDSLGNLYISLSLVLAEIGLIYYISNLRRSPKLPLPPGPKPLPIIGNLFDVPQSKPWITYMDWSKAYGSDLIFMNLFFQPSVVVCSVKAAIDLMEKRSAIYSDKPQFVMDQVVGWEWNFGLMPYGQMWRDRRRCFHQYFNQGAVGAYHAVQIREVHAFLRRALVSPARNVDAHSISQTLAAMLLDITYGIRISDTNDEYIELSRKAVEGFMLSRKPGGYMVDYIPFLKYVPAWVPGASGKKLGKLYKPIAEDMRDLPYDAAKNDVLAGIAASSVAQKVIYKLEKTFAGTNTCLLKGKAARDALGIAYAAAVDTQLSTMSSFTLAMAKYPDAQRKAQKELDDVLGSDSGRLPEHSDINRLPYIRAILLESLRWMPTAPLGVPHRVMVDDEYNGHQIPKGSTIIANAWAMLHNPEDYPNPDVFNPDRFIRNGELNPDVRDPSTIAFGFGRRICAGRHLANDILFLFMASILYTFDIEQACDANGNPAPVEPEPTSGQISHLNNIPCVLKPRSATAERLVRKSESL